MSPSATARFENFAAERLRGERFELARRWVSSIGQSVHVRPRHAFPEDDILQAAPFALGGLADFLLTDEVHALASAPSVREPVRAIARLRFEQGCTPEELIHELDLLAGLLDAACIEWLEEFGSPPPPVAVARVVGRLNRAAVVMAEIVVGAYREEEHRPGTADGERVRLFLEEVSHELKTPLGAAETAAYALEDDEIVSTSQERRRFARVLQRSLRRARAVIDDLRGLALVDVSGSRLSRNLPLGIVLGTVLVETRDNAEAAGVRIEVVEPVPDILVDAAPLELVLLNLIANAVKYSDADKTGRWVRIRFESEEGEKGEVRVWWVSVEDNGIGISPEHRPRIFERGFRAQPHRTRGTGLGLAIVREAASVLGAQLHLESELGVGTTFRFSVRDAGARET